MGEPGSSFERGARVRALVALLVASSAVWLLRLGPEPPPVRCASPVPVVPGEPRVRCDGVGVGRLPAGTARVLGQPLDLNALTRADLESLPGVGPSLAGRILEERSRRGGFRSVEELGEVKGIGPAKLAALRAALHAPRPQGVD